MEMGLHSAETTQAACTMPVFMQGWVRPSLSLALVILQAETPIPAHPSICKDAVFPLSHQESLRNRKRLTGLNISSYSPCEGGDWDWRPQHQPLKDCGLPVPQGGSPSARGEGKKRAERWLRPCCTWRVCSCSSRCFTCPRCQQGQRALEELGFSSASHPFTPGAPKSSLGYTSFEAFESAQRGKCK